MSWYYADGGQQRGPVTDDELSALLAAGAITADTLVWREGLPGWEPLSKARPVEAVPTPMTGPVAAPSAPADGSARCAVCGQAFPAGDLVEIAGSRACASCKPMAIQRLREGAPGVATAAGAGADEGTLSEEEVLARDYEVPVSEAISQGLNRMFAEPGTLLAGGALVTLVSFAIQAVPYLGGLIALFIQGPLMGGLMLAYLRRIRGGTMGIDTAFQGFGPRFWPMFRAHIVPTLLASLAYIPAVAVAVPLFIAGMATGNGLPAPALVERGDGVPLFIAGMATGNVVPGVLGIVAFSTLMLAGVVVGTYLTVSWMYTLMLVADRGYRVLPAMGLSRRMVARHFWQHLWLMIAFGLVMLLGVIALCFGLFVAMPVVSFAQAFVYHRVFNGLRPAPAPLA